MNKGLRGDVGPQGIQGEQGVQGNTGPKGDAGSGIATGGIENQILAKKSSSDYDTKWVDPQVIPTELSDLSDDSTHRLVIDIEKSTWNGKQDSIGYTTENQSNKVTSISGSSTDIQYPSAKLLYDQLSSKVDKIVGKGLSTNDLTDVLKSTYDGYSTSKENTGVASGLITNHNSTYVHSDIALNSSARHSHINKSDLDLLSGTNTGDETTNSIKTKLGSASTTTDGYLTSGDWNIFNNKGTDVSTPIIITDNYTMTSLTENFLMSQATKDINIAILSPSGSNKKITIYNDSKYQIKVLGIINQESSQTLYNGDSMDIKDLTDRWIII